jgi:DNA-binding beta-propeller fold protein YncE
MSDPTNEKRAMRPVFNRIVKVSLWGLLVLMVVAGFFLARLIYIADPTRVASLQFQGYVLLPRGSVLSILDYLTVSEPYLFVTSESTGSVYRIKLHGTTLPLGTDVTELRGDPAAHGVALEPSKQVAYASRSEANAVDVFDPNTMKPMARIPVADDADAIFFDSAHNLVYVANGDAHLATLIDPHSRKVVSTIALGGKPEYSVLDPQSSLRYQNLRDRDAVVAVDLGSRTVAQKWDLPGCVEPTGMALDEGSRRLFIVCSANARFVVFDLSAHHVVTSLPIGGGPDSVAFDAPLHRIYTTGKSGVLSIIQQDTADSYRVLDEVRLHFGAHTLAVDPATHSVYVGYASLWVKPRVAMFTARR